MMLDPKIILDVYNLKKEETPGVEKAPVAFPVEGFKYIGCRQTGAR